MNNNLTKVERIVIIVTVVAVFMVFGGIGYAFFTANNPAGSTALITNTSGRMTISYADGGSNLLVSDKITPSNIIIVNKTFTLTGVNTASAGTGMRMSYKVGIKYTSSFSDGQIHYYIKKVSSSNNNVTTNFIGELNQTVPGNTSYTGYSHGTLNKGNNIYKELVTGEFPASSSSQAITFNLLMQFPDTGENQDSEKGKSLTANIEINHEINASEYIANLDKTSNGLEIDDTDDQNLRYVGATPNNYISFNNELWRIIGVFDVTNADTKKKENLVKIIRNKTLGRYSWDTSDSNINSGQGINEWSQAKLMYELNTDYIDTSKTSGTTTWYNWDNNQKTAIYDYSNNIKSGYIDKIATVRWNLGGVVEGQTTIKTYNQERGTFHISNPSDGIKRTDYWDGKIGLMYSSDYGYASTDIKCRNNLSSSFCKNSNWLFNSSYQWTISSASYGVSVTLAIVDTGEIVRSQTKYTQCNRPSLYLKSNAQIVSGTGTSTDPYILK